MFNWRISPMDKCTKVIPIFDNSVQWYILVYQGVKQGCLSVQTKRENDQP